MKAAVYNSYGKPEVVQLKEVDKPTPQNNEIVVKVNATTVTAGDWRMRAGDPYVMRFYNGFRKLKRTILGHEFAGIVDCVGADVTQFSKRDLVFGYTGSNAGAHAEYVAIPADGVISHKPVATADQDAAALPVGGLTALHFFRKAKIRQGQKVLVYGASGSVGSYAVQLAKHFGAVVTAVCSGANADLARSLGADKVIDYQREDFAQSSEKYDIIFDAVGKTSYDQSKKILKSGGAYLTVAMSFSLMIHSVINELSKKHRLISGIAKMTAEELQFLTNLLETGALKPVIDSTYPLSEIQKAHERAETGHKKGNIVILTNKNSEPKSNEASI